EAVGTSSFETRLTRTRRDELHTLAHVPRAIVSHRLERVPCSVLPCRIARAFFSESECRRVYPHIRHMPYAGVFMYVYISGQVRVVRPRQTEAAGRDGRVQTSDVVRRLLVDGRPQEGPNATLVFEEVIVGDGRL
ncbi:hypothetical protein DBV15_04880, partial [Temnothorax longispinosus]